MSDSNSGHVGRSSRINIIALGAVYLVLIGIVSFNFQNGLVLTAQYHSLMEVVTEIKQEIFTTNLKIENLRTGDSDGSLDEAFRHLELADQYANALLSGGETPHGAFSPLHDEQLRERIEVLRSEMVLLRAVTLQGFDPERSASDSLGEYTRDVAFQDCIFQADTIETRLQQLADSRLSSFRSRHTLLICSVLLIGLLLGIIVLLYDRRRNRDYLTILKTKEELEAQIMGRRQTKANLRVSESRNRALLEAIPDTIAVLNRQGDYSYYKAEYGTPSYLPSPYIGKNITDVMPPTIARQALEAIAAVLDSGEVKQVEYALLFGDRQEKRYFQARISGLGDGKQVLALLRDITESKRAEETLRRSEEKFQSIFSNSVVGFYRTSPAGEIIWANQALVDMLGFDSMEELLARNLEKDGFEPEYPRTEFKQRLAQAGRVVSFEYPWKHCDGSLIWMNENAVAIPDDKGAIAYYDGTVEDISERKLAQEALRESEAKHRALIEQLPAITYLASVKEGDSLLYLSPQIEDLLGFQAEELIQGQDGLLVSQLHDEDRSRVLAELQLAREKGQPFNCVYRLLTKTGETRWFRDHARLVEGDDGIPLYLQGVMLDITEWKQAELELARERAKAEYCLNLANMLLVAIDARGEITLINRKGCEILGYEEEEIIGKNWCESFIPASQMSEVIWVEQKLLAGEIKPVEYYENLIRTRSGEERLIAWHNSVLTDDDGSITGFLSSGMDITERRQAETELRRQREQSEKLKARKESVS